MEDCRRDKVEYAAVQRQRRHLGGDVVLVGSPGAPEMERRNESRQWPFGLQTLPACYLVADDAKMLNGPVESIAYVFRTPLSPKQYASFLASGADKKTSS